VDLDAVVLAAATALVGFAQLGIVMTSRTRSVKDTVSIGLTTVAVVVLFMLAWLEIAS
jgi:hypothetical protein